MTTADAHVPETVRLERILCPIDLSEASAQALHHAVASARWYGAEITVCHVYREPLQHDDVAVLPPIDPQDVVEKVRRFLGSVMSGGLPEIVVLEGSPAKEITRLAERLPADLVVMGTHGRGGFERLFLGSVAEKVLRVTRCPVLTVAPLVEGPLAGPVLYRTILCPLDFSEASQRALEYAISLAKEAGSRLVLLHVMEGVSDRPRELAHFTVPEYDLYMQRDAKARLAAAIPEAARSWFQTEELITSGKVYREILRVADESAADLIVMGVHGRDPVDDFLFGSTAQHVVRRAMCPVLTLRRKPAPPEDERT